MQKYELSLAINSKPGSAEAIRDAISPELNAKHAKRSTTSVAIKKDVILINIKARDKTALRAATNSCLNSIILSNSMLEV